MELGSEFLWHLLPINILRIMKLPAQRMVFGLILCRRLQPPDTSCQPWLSCRSRGAPSLRLQHRCSILNSCLWRSRVDLIGVPSGPSVVWPHRLGHPDDTDHLLGRLALISFLRSSHAYADTAGSYCAAVCVRSSHTPPSGEAEACPPCRLLQPHSPPALALSPSFLGCFIAHIFFFFFLLTFLVTFSHLLCCPVCPPSFGSWATPAAGSAPVRSLGGTLRGKPCAGGTDAAQRCPARPAPQSEVLLTGLLPAFPLISSFLSVLLSNFPENGRLFQEPPWRALSRFPVCLLSCPCVHLLSVTEAFRMH